MIRWLLRKALVKGHYRRLPNGKIIWIDDYRDKRDEAKKDPKSFRHTFVHADEKSTTVVHQGQLKTYDHKPENELSKDDIHDYLNQTVSLSPKFIEELRTAHPERMYGDYSFPDDVFKLMKQGMTRERAIMEAAKQRATNAGLTEKEDVEDYERTIGIQFDKYLKENHKELKKELGEFSTVPQLMRHSSLYRNVMRNIADNQDADYHTNALAKLAAEHSEDAEEAERQNFEDNEKAAHLTHRDCPKIPGIDPKVTAIPHQAEVLAKLNVLTRAIVDVDMGGGKGFLLPADAVNLMHQGKVKRPLIVATGMTLHQNAQVTLKYTGGRFNVFVIDNDLIKNHYKNDLEKLVADIKAAPSNTIFMTSYDVLGHNRGEVEFERAKALSSAGFDLVSLDESQKVKNAESLRFQALQYFSHAKYKRLATGTFLTRDPADAVGQLAWMYPGRTPSVEDFAKQYGFEKTKEGFMWNDKGVRKLREDLRRYGYIGVRRSAWFHLLPERQEQLSVVQLTPQQALANEMSLTDSFDALEAFGGHYEPDDLALAGSGEKSSPVKTSLDTLAGIVDHPHEYAQKAKEAVALCQRAGVDFGYDPAAWSPKEEVEGLHDNKQVAAAQLFLKKFKPQTLKAILALDGTVSAKAKDCYQKIEEHLKRGQGKYIVFTKRVNSARHVFDNLPKHIRDQAVYYDGSNKEGLEPFLKDNKTKIIVACDESIKEGVNMQVANGMYRYDLGWTPGETEQSYGRIWRFGQKNPCTIHIGISNGTQDVTKYARLMSRMNSNMKAVSDYDEVPGFMGYKMSTDNIRKNRHADILPKYEEVSKAILAYQREEAKGLRAKFGDQPLPIAGQGELPGSKKASGPGYAVLEGTGNPSEPKTVRDDVKKPSSSETRSHPAQPRKVAEESKAPVKKPKPAPEPEEEDEEEEDQEPHNAAGWHHIEQAALHLTSGRKDVATEHWRHAVAHVKHLPRHKRDQTLVALLKDKGAFKEAAEEFRSEHQGKVPKTFTHHELDSLLLQTPTTEELAQGKAPRVIRKEQQAQVVPAKKAIQDALKHHDIPIGSIDKATLREVVEDAEHLFEELGSEAPSAQNTREFWREWAKRYNDVPDDAHKNVVHHAVTLMQGGRKNGL